MSTFYNTADLLHILFKDRDAYCDKVTTTPSQDLESLLSKTLSYPFEKVYKEGKTVGFLNPIMISGHLEGNQT